MIVLLAVLTSSLKSDSNNTNIIRLQLQMFGHIQNSFFVVVKMVCGEHFIHISPCIFFI